MSKAQITILAVLGILVVIVYCGLGFTIYNTVRTSQLANIPLPVNTPQPTVINTSEGIYVMPTGVTPHFTPPPTATYSSQAAAGGDAKIEEQLNRAYENWSCVYRMPDGGIRNISVSERKAVVSVDADPDLWEDALESVVQDTIKLTLIDGVYVAFWWVSELQEIEVSVYYQGNLTLVATVSRELADDVAQRYADVGITDLLEDTYGAPTTSFSALEFDYADAVLDAFEATWAAIDADGYLLEVSAVLESQGNAFLLAGDLMVAASIDSSLLLDAEWQTKMGVALGMIKIYAEDVRAIEPPSELEACHADLVEAALHSERYADLVAEGMNELDAGKLEMSSQEIDLALEYLTRGTDCLKERTQP